MAKFSKSRREVPLFRRYLDFLVTQCRTGKKKPSCQNQINLIERRLVIDTDTDRHRQTQGHS